MTLTTIHPERRIGKLNAIHNSESDTEIKQYLRNTSMTQQYKKYKHTHTHTQHLAIDCHNVVL